MAPPAPQPEIGSSVRKWRNRRRVTQLELGLDAQVSTRHLSFIESGRSRPGRETLRRILQQLEVPFREQNRLLLAAGHAPAYPERTIDDSDLAPVRQALDLVLERHEPYPAIVVDRYWDLVASNSAVMALTEAADIDPALLEPPVNVLRIGLHPRGLAPLLINAAHWRAHFRSRIDQQTRTTGDERLAALLNELDSYSSSTERQAQDPNASEMLGPLKMRAPDGTELSFLGMFATFDTPFEVTASELAIELMFPVDKRTEETLRTLIRRR